MKIIIRIYGLLFFVMLVAAGNVSALDEVFTSDGHRFKGIVSKEDERTITIEADVGTVLLNRADILHIEKDVPPDPKVEDTEESVSGFEGFKKTMLKLLDDSGEFSLKSLKRYNRFVFRWLARQPLYQSICKVQFVRTYKRKHPGAFVMAVYMSMLLIVGFVLSILEKVVKSCFCRIFNIKQRYDL